MSGEYAKRVASFAAGVAALVAVERLASTERGRLIIAATLGKPIANRLTITGTLAAGQRGAYISQTAVNMSPPSIDPATLLDRLAAVVDDLTRPSGAGITLSQEPSTWDGSDR